MPGRDRNFWVDLIGNILFWAALTGVIIHSLARVLSALAKKEIDSEDIKYN